MPQGKAKLVMQTREKQPEELTLDEEAGTGKNGPSCDEVDAGGAGHLATTSLKDESENAAAIDAAR